MPIKQITPAQAHELVRGGFRYLDVRTETEFAAGHPAGAVNVPVVLADPATRQMQLNSDFLAVVEAHFSKETPLVIGCLSGGRSQRAAEMLAEAGYLELQNMQGGFGGLRDQTGRVVTPGWQECGLPVCHDCGEANTYAGLRGRR